MGVITIDTRGKLLVKRWAVPWPAFGAAGPNVVSLVTPQPHVETDFASRHHCSLWTAG